MENMVRTEEIGCQNVMPLESYSMFSIYKKWLLCVCWFSDRMVNIWGQRSQVQVHCDVSFKIYLLIDKKIEWLLYGFY